MLMTLRNGYERVIRVMIFSCCCTLTAPVKVKKSNELCENRGHVGKGHLERERNKMRLWLPTSFSCQFSKILGDASNHLLWEASSIVPHDGSAFM